MKKRISLLLVLLLMLQFLSPVVALDTNLVETTIQVEQSETIPVETETTSSVVSETTVQDTSSDLVKIVSESTVSEDPTTNSISTESSPKPDATTQSTTEVVVTSENTAETSQATETTTVEETTSATSTQTLKLYEIDAAGVITNYNGTEIKLVIPSQVDGVTVTGIAKKAFENKKLVEVTIPETVKEIGEGAFANNKLTKVNFINEPKSSLTTIGKDAFIGNQLTTVNLPESVTTVADNAFDKSLNIEGLISEVVDTPLMRSAPAALKAVDPIYQLVNVVNTNINGVAPNFEFFTYEYMQGEIAVDAIKLEGKLLNAYVDITVPLDLIARFEIAPGSFAISSRNIIDAAQNTWTKRVYINELDSTVNGTFEYNLIFKSRIVPNGYQLKPFAKFYTQEDPVTKEGEFIKDADNQAVMTAKYRDPTFVKALNAKNYTLDNQTTYGGNTTDGTSIDPNGAADVTFYFTNNVDAVFRGPLSYNPGIHTTRAAQEIIITETLPTYTDASGAVKTAVFSAADNPGWVLNQDGTISYRVVASPDTTATQPGVYVSMGNVPLRLKFPGAKLNTDITNHASFQIIPMGMHNDAAGNPINDYPKTFSDNIKFRLTSTIFKPGAFAKTTNSGTTTGVDPDNMHNRHVQFSLQYSNSHPYPIDNVLIRDTNFDNTNLLEILGVKPDGTKEPINGQITNQTILQRNLTINAATKSAILEAVNTYEAAAAIDPTVEKPTLNLTPEYIGFEIRLARPLNTGEALSVYPIMKYIDPYNIHISDVAAENVLSNTAEYGGALVLPDGSRYTFGPPINGVQTDQGPIERSSTVRLVPLKEYISMYQDFRFNFTGNEGESLYISSGVTFTELTGKTRIINGRLITILPEAVDFLSFYQPDRYPNLDFGNATIIPNYKNTGRTYIEVPLKNTNFYANEYSGLGFGVNAKINSLGTNATNITNPSLDNRIYHYFSADGLYESMDGTDPLGGIMDKPTVTNRTPQADFFDINNNGDKDEILVGLFRDMIVSLPREVLGRKSIRINDTDPWSRRGIETLYGMSFQYRLEVVNNGTSTLNTLSLYDNLPKTNDTSYFLADDGLGYVPRGSGFANVLTGPVIAPGGFTVYYSKIIVESNPGAAVASTQGWTSDVAAWGAADWAAVKSIKIVMNEGVSIPPSTTETFILNMRAPVYVKGQKHSNDQANNNFAVTYNNINWGQSNTVYNRLLQQFDVKKVWTGPAADEVSVKLLQNGVPYKFDSTGDGNLVDWVLKLSEANGWEDTFYDLPSLDAEGHQYVYTVNETAITHFEKDVDGAIVLDPNTGEAIVAKSTTLGASQYTLKMTPTMNGNLLASLVLDNTYKSPTVGVSVDLTWLNGSVLEKPTVQLFLQRGDGTAVLDAAGNPVFVELQNGMFTADFGDQPVFDDLTGEPITYTVVQKGLDGTPWIESPDFPITEITPARKDGGELMTPATYAAADVVDTLIHVTNQYVQPLADVKATKTYVGGNTYPAVWFQLYRASIGENNGAAYIVQDETVDPAVDLAPEQVLGNTPNSTVVWSDMPTTDLEGNTYTYSVKEVDADGADYVPGISVTTAAGTFESAYVKSGEDTLAVTNTYVSPKMPFSADKVWINGADDKPAVELELHRRQGTVVDANFVEKITLTETSVADADKVISADGTQETWTYTWTDLDVTDGNAVPYTYYVVEPNAPAGFDKISENTLGIDGAAPRTIIENQYIVPLQDVKVEKKWVGGYANNRPAVALQLDRQIAGGAWEKVEQVTLDGKLDEDGDGEVWTYTWKDLPTTDLKANTYTYKVNETIVPVNFQETYSDDGLVVTNTYASPKTEKAVVKQWIGGPAEKPSVTFVLYRQLEGQDKEEAGRVVLTAVDVLPKADDAIAETVYWGHTFEDLDLTDVDAKPYVYTVEELTVPDGFVSELIPGTLTIVNKFVPPTVDLTADIAWLNGELLAKPEVRLSLKYKTLVDGVEVLVDARDVDGQPIVGVVNTDGIVTFPKVALTDTEGNALEFTVVQEGLAGSLWTNKSISSITPLKADGSIGETNVHVVNEFVPPTASVTADTEWIGGESVDKPDTILKLMVQDPLSKAWKEATNSEGQAIVGSLNTESGKWTYPDVPLMDAAGNLLLYTVVQSGLEGSLWNEQSISIIQPGNADGTVNEAETNVHVVNAYDPDTVTLTADTEWLGGSLVDKPNTTLSLMVKNPEGGAYIPAKDKDGKTITGTRDASGRWSFPNVPLTDASGNALTYTVVQSGLEGSVWVNKSISEITPQKADGSIGETNVHVVNAYQVPEVQITATNQWINSPEIDSSTFVTYTLIRTVTVDGVTKTEEVEVDLVPNADGSYNFGKVPTTDSEGRAYTYTVKQTFVDPESGKPFTTTISSITPAVDPTDLNIEIVNRKASEPTLTPAPTPGATEPTPTPVVTEPKPTLFFHGADKNSALHFHGLDNFYAASRGDRLSCSACLMRRHICPNYTHPRRKMDNFYAASRGDRLSCRARLMRRHFCTNALWKTRHHRKI